MKPSMLKFSFGQEQMEILIQALTDYKRDAQNDNEAREEADDMLQAFKAQLGWALAE